MPDSNISEYSLFIMTRLLRVLAAGLFFLACNTEGSVTIFVPHHTPLDASDPIPKDFQSLSIELAYWPDVAGNQSSPNDFTNNLLHNLEEYTGHAPLLRIGGGTQFFLFNQLGRDNS